MQKLQHLVGLLAKQSKSQKDIATLERILFEVCKEAMQTESSFGAAIRGPGPWSELERNKLPAELPPWSHIQMAKLPDFQLANGYRLTTSSLQASFV